MALTQGIALLAVFTWVLLRTFRHFVLKTSLENIPGPAPESFLTGAFGKIFNNNGWEFHKYLSRTYGNTVRFQGILGRQELYTFDPKALHYIFVKEQNVFEETDEFITMNNLLFGPGLLGTLGDQHRKQRKMLNPVFSIAHMRDMIPIFYRITHRLKDAFLLKVQNGPHEIEVLSWMTRTALELICQSGLGHSYDDLTEDKPPHPYAAAVKMLIPTLSDNKMRYATGFLLPRLPTHILPKSLSRWIVDNLPWKALHDVREIVDLMHNTSVDIYESKKRALEKGDAALEDQISRGKDIMSILMKANMVASKEESMTREEIIGQMSALMFAAMDTTSTALSRLLHLLSNNQDVQERLRKEVQSAREAEGGDLPYDTIVSLPYLDAISRETLRLYPPVTMVRRVARKDTVLPLLNPIKGLDGKEITEVFMSKGMPVTIGIMASNTNSQIWGPDANEWKPERWMSPLPEEVISAHLPGVYANLMTFIGGSRACIGFKFSQLEMKVVLSLLIETFRFSPAKAEIAWQMSGVVTPSVVGPDGVSPQPQLPLLVERI